MVWWLKKELLDFFNILIYYILVKSGIKFRKKILIILVLKFGIYYIVKLSFFLLGGKYRL